LTSNQIKLLRQLSKQIAMPEPLSTTFATLVGLIVNYRQEKSAKEALDHQKFIEWLDYHKHEEIKNLICNTAALQNEVDKLLRADHAIIIEKLDAVNSTLASLMSQVAEFRGLALAMMPDSEISDQAISILRQLVESDSKFIIYADYVNMVMLQLQSGGPVEFTDQRFLKDDMNKLVGLGLLTPEYSDRETVLLHVTRNATRLIGAIGKSSPT
jgi:hypothetical protein